MVFVSVGWFFWPADREEAQGKPLLLLASHSTTLKGERERGAPLGESRALCFMNTESRS